MPRVSRFSIEFPVNDEVWVAKFEHQHSRDQGGEEIGTIYVNPKTSKAVLVRHITKCRLALKGAGISVIGVSTCSLKDEYNWRYGIKNSFQRALASAGFCEEITEKKGRLHISSGKHYRQHEFMPLLPAYNVAIGSFFRELPIKAYPPHMDSMTKFIVDALEGEVVNVTPVENLNGLHYSGAD